MSWWCRVLSLAGLRSWNVDLTVCDLNKELQLFEARHTAQFSSRVKGQSEVHGTIPWRCPHSNLLRLQERWSIGAECESEHYLLGGRRVQALRGEWSVHKYSALTVAQRGQTGRSEDVLAESMELSVHWERIEQKQSDLGVHVSSHAVLWLLLLCKE